MEVLIPLVIEGVCLVICVAIGRRHKWALVPWLPALALSAIATVKFLMPAIAALHVPILGIIASAGMFLLAVPAVLFLVIAFIQLPVGAALNIRGAIAGAVLTFCILFALARTTGKRVEVTVLDAKGMPVAGVKVMFKGPTFFSFQNSVPSVASTTDLYGTADAYLASSDNWSAEADTVDGTHCSVAVGPQQWDRVLPGHSDYFILSLGWSNPKWGDWFASSAQAYVPEGGHENLEIHLRNVDETDLPWLVEMAHRDIERVRLGKQDQRLVTISERSVERLEIVPDLLELIRSKPLNDDSTSNLLNDAGNILGIWGNAAFNGLTKTENGNARDMFSAYQRMVISNHPTETPEDVDAGLKSRLNDFTAQLVDLSAPLWPTKGLVGIGKAGILAKPYFPQIFSYLETLKEDDPHLLNDFQFFEGLSYFKGDGALEVEEVRPYFDNPNRIVAVSALLSVKWKTPGKSCWSASRFCRIPETNRKSNGHLIASQMVAVRSEIAPSGLATQKTWGS